MILELVNWRTQNGILWGAVPTGRFKGSYREFATSSLIGIGVGIYEYFMQNADSTTIKSIYPPVKEYLLKVWEMEPNSLVSVDRIDKLNLTEESYQLRTKIIKVI